MLRHAGYFLSCLVTENLHPLELHPQMGGLSITRTDIRMKIKYWCYQDIEITTETLEESFFKTQIPRGLRWSDTCSSALGIWLLLPFIHNTELTLNLLVHVFLYSTETQVRVLTVVIGQISTSEPCPWGPSATRELIEVTTGVSPPVHRRQDAAGRLPALIGPAH